MNTTRPCTCDRVRPGESYAAGRDCPHCWHWTHTPDIRAAWGGDPNAVVPVREPRKTVADWLKPKPCRHRGGATGEVRICTSCTGRVEVPVLSCAVHGTCYTGNFTPDGWPRPKSCSLCREREAVPPVPVVDQGASGIGDALLGLLALPEGAEYRVSATAEPFVKLFDGWSAIGRHAKGHSEAPVDGAVQMNGGYTREQAEGYPVPRWERYRKNVGAPALRVPKLRDPDRVRAAGADLPGRVVLAPWSADPARQWPLDHWLELERQLNAAGHTTAVVHSRATVETARFKRSALVLGEPAGRVAGVMLQGRMVVANDSGMAHLGGILGARTLVLGGGPIPLDRVFGAYPRAEWLRRETLADLTPADVFAAVTMPVADPVPPVYVPYIGRPDLLDKAIASLGRHKGRVVVIDNSVDGLDPIPGVQVHRPAVPLNVSQTYWWFQETREPVYYFFHSDATTTEEAIDRLDAAVLEANRAWEGAGQRWGLITTLHDKLAAFHGAAIRSAGVWPDLHLPVYGVDTDYYRRMVLAGLPTIDRPEIGRLVVHPDRTPNLDDPAHQAFVETTDHTGYYVRKWGGIAGAEAFTLPWNGAPTPDRPKDRGPGLVPRLAELVPFRAYTEADDAEQLRHLTGDTWLYEPGGPRYLCSLLGAVHADLRHARPDLARLVREAVMIGRRLNDFGTRQSDLDWTSDPKFVGGSIAPAREPEQVPAGRFRLSVVMPTRGRASLARAVASVVPQLAHGDELIVERDESGDWGAAARMRAIRQASGDYLVFLDDDDDATPTALADIRAALAANPGRPHLFRMRYADGRTLWTDRAVRFGNVGTPMFVTPNDRARLGVWGTGYDGDYQFITSTVAKYAADSLVWREEVICDVRP